MKKLLASVAIIGFLTPSLALAQSTAGNPAPVQQNASRLDAATNVLISAGSVNESQTTITIPSSGSSCIYVDSLILAVGSDATGATATETFTTTNLAGIGWTFNMIVGTTGYGQPSQQLVGASPIKGSCGVAATIVSPAQATHFAYPMFVAWHYAQ